jgi:hypothetical protein
LTIWRNHTSKIRGGCDRLPELYLPRGFQTWIGTNLCSSSDGFEFLDNGILSHYYLSVRRDGFNIKLFLRLRGFA